jgi:hypothetical protein
MALRQILAQFANFRRIQRSLKAPGTRQSGPLFVVGARQEASRGYNKWRGATLPEVREAKAPAAIGGITRGARTRALPLQKQTVLVRGTTSGISKEST